MNATSLSLSSIYKILDLDFLELWIELNGAFHCLIRTDSNGAVVGKYDESLNDYQNVDARLDYEFSIMKCKQVQQLPSHLSWDVVNDGNAHNQRTTITYLLPVFTGEIPYFKQEYLTNLHIYLLGGSDRLVYRDEARITYLQSLSMSLYISIFGIDKFEVEELSSASSGRIHLKNDTEYNNNNNKSQSCKTGRNGGMSFDIDFFSDSAGSSSSGSLGHNSESLDGKSNFKFSINKIPIQSTCTAEININEIENITHITNGTNSNIFMGVFRGEEVIIKMVAKELANDELVLGEFNMEINILSRVSHPNILRFLGAGNNPQRFIVLEWLGGGTLELLLKNEEIKPEILGFIRESNSTPKISFSTAISYAYDLASTLSYLHSKCHPGATIIHRDLKPDNIAFTSDGKLKLLDFGLCACVKTRRVSSDTYEMTGNTGSLRYMAPEVILCRPYTEKADVYSFAIIVWQMASNALPYDDIKTRSCIVNRVALGRERPKLDKKWSPYFKRLLEACWHADFEQRPSFNVIVAELQKIKDSEIKMRITLPQIKLPSLTNVLNRKESSRDYTKSF